MYEQSLLVADNDEPLDKIVKSTNKINFCEDLKNLVNYWEETNQLSNIERFKDVAYQLLNLPEEKNK